MKRLTRFVLLSFFFFVLIIIFLRAARGDSGGLGSIFALELFFKFTLCMKKYWFNLVSMLLLIVFVLFLLSQLA